MIKEMRFLIYRISAFCLFAGLITGFMFPQTSNAQCKSFIKDNCQPKLEMHTPVFQGVIDVPILIEDGKVLVPTVFRGRKRYRVLFCSEKILGDVRFKIINARNEVIFDNKEHDLAQAWDFTFKTSQKVSIEMTINKFDMSDYSGVDARLSDDYKKMTKSCVAVMVGMR